MYAQMYVCMHICAQRYFCVCLCKMKWSVEKDGLLQVLPRRSVPLPSCAQICSGSGIYLIQITFT